MEVLSEVKAERNSGNIEYKLKLESPSIDRVDHLTTQMIFRLNEGFGRAIYRVGV
jgi:GTPase